jgi:hypothetical protein
VEYDEKYSRIFPAHWEMAERLTVEFCKITRLDLIGFCKMKHTKILFNCRRELGNIMLKRKNEIDVKLLRFAIEKTVGFETIVEKRFVGNTLDHANNPITNHLNGKFYIYNSSGKRKGIRSFSKELTKIVRISSPLYTASLSVIKFSLLIDDVLAQRSEKKECINQDSSEITNEISFILEFDMRKAFRV